MWLIVGAVRTKVDTKQVTAACERITIETGSGISVTKSNKTATIRTNKAQQFSKVF